MLHQIIGSGKGMDIGDVTKDRSGPGRVTVGAFHLLQGCLVLRELVTQINK
jgi:hypothetical protein